MKTCDPHKNEAKYSCSNCEREGKGLIYLCSQCLDDSPHMDHEFKKLPKIQNNQEQFWQKFVADYQSFDQGEGKNVFKVFEYIKKLEIKFGQKKQQTDEAYQIYLDIFCGERPKSDIILLEKYREATKFLDDQNLLYKCLDEALQKYDTKMKEIYGKQQNINNPIEIDQEPGEITPEKQQQKQMLQIFPELAQIQHPKIEEKAHYKNPPGIDQNKGQARSPDTDQYRSTQVDSQERYRKSYGRGQRQNRDKYDSRPRDGQPKQIKGSSLRSRSRSPPNWHSSKRRERSRSPPRNEMPKKKLSYGRGRRN